MPGRKTIHLRGARDRLVDLLEIGETSPLQDTDVVNERLTVPIGDHAKVPVVPGQTDVRYLLRRRDGGSSPPGPGKVGNGVETILLTPKIERDVTFRVLGRKVDSGREAYLHRMATVRVGLDARLKPRIEAPLLDPSAGDDTDPRIVDFGSPIVVAIDQSQEGVDYRLVHLPNQAGGSEVDLSSTEVRGDRGTIQLGTDPLFENVMVRVRVTKRFDPSEDREDQSELIVGADGAPLELPLEVRPNPDLRVTVEPSNVFDLGEEATIKVSGTQVSCRYQLYLRQLEDRDFLFDDDVADARVAEVDLAEEGGHVRVIVPPSPAGEPVEGFVAVGTPLAGSGADLRMPLGSSAVDSQVLVEASKERSATWLDEVGTVLVKPDADRRLALRVEVAGASMRGDAAVAGGEPGVFYHLRRGATGSERSLPAYFHQLDELDHRLNKGLGGVGEPTARRGLRVGVDLAISRGTGGERPSGAPPDRALARPEPPVVELGRLPLGIVLHVRAVKARSGVDVELSHAAPVFELPEIRLEEAVVDAGASARILVMAADAGDRYQPFLDDEPVKQARIGDGGDLVFVTGEVQRPTTFELRVSRQVEGFDLVQVVPLSVEVRPAGGGS